MTQKTNFYKTIHETQNRCLNDLSKRTVFFYNTSYTSLKNRPIIIDKNRETDKLFYQHI